MDWQLRFVLPMVDVGNAWLAGGWNGDSGNVLTVVVVVVAELVSSVSKLLLAG